MPTVPMTVNGRKMSGEYEERTLLVSFLRETLGLIDRAYIIHEGTVLMSGRPREIVANHEVRRVYLGERFRL